MIFWSVLFVMFMGVVISFPPSMMIVEWFLINLSGKDIYAVFFWDPMSMLFGTIVLLISLVVFVYSNYYMDNEEKRLGFITLLFCFVMSMVCLLISPHMITLLLGWDGLGLTSYLLVIYYSSHTSSTAGMLTFLVNRLGDVFFLIALGIFAFQSDWETMMSSHFLLALLIVLAMVTKSAQIPFSAWLPAAMAAPTPVSSLVHSSTLVTAGLYIMIRFSESLKIINSMVLWMGVLTLLAAGLMALMEWDLKKLIAFSTLSQLGFMVTSFAMGLVWLSFFHLITHALFKASLFLSAGVLIHNCDNSQEFRNMFLIPTQLFWLSSIINICILCLCGIPFTSGFYSKDMLIDGGSIGASLFILFMLGVLFTVIYSFRFFSFSHRLINERFSCSLVYEKTWVLFLSINLLILSAICGGYFFFELFFSFKFFIVVSMGWKAMYFFLIILFFLFSYKFNKMVSHTYANNYFISTIIFMKNFCSSKFWKSLFSINNSFLLKNDQGNFEVAGPQGMFSSTLKLSSLMSSFQSFMFSIYFLFFLMSILMI